MDKPDTTFLARALRMWQNRRANDEYSNIMGPRAAGYVHQQTNTPIPLPLQQQLDQLDINEYKKQQLLPPR